MKKKIFGIAALFGMLLGSVNVPAGSSLKKKGTTVILEMP